MKREYDIRYELGPRNWLDAVAGEAVVLGYIFHDVELEMMGTALAERIGAVRFDDDKFSLVEAQALHIKKIIAEKKVKWQDTPVIDEICEYDGGRKSLYKWEYSFLFADGQYVITLMMPEYQGRLPDTENREQVEKVIRESYSDPVFEELTADEEIIKIGHQSKKTTEYRTVGGRLICREIDFQHEDGPKRGRLVTYFYDEYSQAIGAWVDIRAISNQKK